MKQYANKHDIIDYFSWIETSSNKLQSHTPSYSAVGVAIICCNVEINRDYFSSILLPRSMWTFYSLAIFTDSCSIRNCVCKSIRICTKIASTSKISHNLRRFKYLIFLIFDIFFKYYAMDHNLYIWSLGYVAKRDKNHRLWILFLEEICIILFYQEKNFLVCYLKIFHIKKVMTNNSSTRLWRETDVRKRVYCE